MGVVWAGNDREQGQKFAIKLLRSSGSAAARKQLVERARAVIPLRHPNLLPVYEVSSDGHRDFVVMELIEGECVADWLARRPSQQEIASALVAAGKALAAAHQAGVIHRGFKLHNVLRAKDGAVRVSDFGLARGQLLGKEPKVLSAVAVAAGKDLRDSPPPRKQHAVLDASLSQGGVYVGTPGYLAPELLAGHLPDKKSDQFAFCMAMWEALAGTRPFSGAHIDTLEALEQAQRAGVQESDGRTLPAGLRIALVRGLHPDPAERWPDMDTLLAAIERGTAPRPRTAIIAASGAVALGSLITIFLLVRGGDAPELEALPVEDTPAAATACPSAQAAISEVWSDARRARLSSQLAEAGAATMAQLDEVGQRWVSAYKEACSLADEVASQRGLACLMLARERTDAAIAELEGTGADPGALAVSDLLPAIDACVP